MLRHRKWAKMPRLWFVAERLADNQHRLVCASLPPDRVVARLGFLVFRGRATRFIVAWRRRGTGNCLDVSPRIDRFLAAGKHTMKRVGLCPTWLPAVIFPRYNFGESKIPTSKPTAPLDRFCSATTPPSLAGQKPAPARPGPLLVAKQQRGSGGGAQKLPRSRCRGCWASGGRPPARSGSGSNCA